MFPQRVGRTSALKWTMQYIVPACYGMRQYLCSAPIYGRVPLRVYLPSMSSLGALEIVMAHFPGCGIFTVIGYSVEIDKKDSFSFSPSITS